MTLQEATIRLEAITRRILKQRADKIPVTPAQMEQWRQMLRIYNNINRDLAN